jgi:hypothetical protein
MICVKLYDLSRDLNFFETRVQEQIYKKMKKQIRNLTEFM